MTKPDLIPSAPLEIRYAGRSMIFADKQAWRSLVSKVAKGLRTTGPQILFMASTGM
jgi:hypothetical protein